MPPQEGPRPQPQAPQENRETGEWKGFRQEITGLERSLGPRPPLPENPTDEELDRLARQTRERRVFTSFHELHRSNEIVSRRQAIQYAADLERPERRATFQRESYIAASQAATYSEDIAETTQFVAGSLRNYELCQDILIALPAADRTRLNQSRAQAVLYMRALHTATDERVHFANVSWLNMQIREQLAPPQEQRRPEVIAALRTQRDAMLASLPEASRRLQVENPSPAQRLAIQTHATDMERRIMRIVAGQERIESVPEGIVPQQLYLDVLQARYTQIQEEQKRMVESGALRE